MSLKLMSMVTIRSSLLSAFFQLGIRNRSEGIEAVGNQGLDRIRVFIQDRRGQHLAHAVVRRPAAGIPACPPCRIASGRVREFLLHELTGRFAAGLARAFLEEETAFGLDAAHEEFKIMIERRMVNFVGVTAPRGSRNERSPDGLSLADLAGKRHDFVGRYTGFLFGPLAVCRAARNPAVPPALHPAVHVLACHKGVP